MKRGLAGERRVLIHCFGIAWLERLLVFELMRNAGSPVLLLGYMIYWKSPLFGDTVSSSISFCVSQSIVVVSLAVLLGK